jgi:hypothetical protein
MLIPFGILSAAGAGVGVAGDYELIETSILTSNQSSVTFSNLGTYSSTYKHLQIRLVARGNRDTFAQDQLRLYINGDTTLSNYNVHELTGNGSTVISGYAANQNYELAYVTGSQSTANAFGAGVADILDAYSTSKFKTVRSLSGHVTPDAGGATGKRVALTSMLWRNTASITSLRIDSLDTTLIAGSRFSLYGVKG